MRLSSEKKSDVIEINAHKEFAKKVFENTTPDERRGGLFLVGGSSSRHQIVRQAQAALRLDNLASYWSHAAIILEWDKPSQAIGAEVSWEPLLPNQQVPERNGVTLFQLSRYLNHSDEYPNLAFASFMFDESPDHTSTAVQHVNHRSSVIEAALHPNQDRFRYRLLDWLRIWSGYTYQPHGQINPLLIDIAVPGAGFCEYAFEAAGIDLTPGATTSNTCPELLWSTLLYWQKRIGEHVQSVKLFKILGDPSCKSRKPLSPDLEDDLLREQRSPTIPSEDLSKFLWDLFQKLRQAHTHAERTRIIRMADELKKKGGMTR